MSLELLKESKFVLKHSSMWVEICSKSTRDFSKASVAGEPEGTNSKQKAKERGLLVWITSVVFKFRVNRT
mgnify:CR=1 FL=1